MNKPLTKNNNDKFTNVLSKVFPIYFAIKNKVQSLYKFTAFLFVLTLFAVSFVANIFNINIHFMNVVLIYSFGAVVSSFLIEKRSQAEKEKNNLYSLDFNKNENTKKIHKKWIDFAKNNTFWTYVTMYLLVIQAILSQDIINTIISNDITNFLFSFIFM